MIRDVETSDDGSPALQSGQTADGSPVQAVFNFGMGDRWTATQTTKHSCRARPATAACVRSPGRPQHDVKCLKPFWRYYGGKYRAAPRYPAPLHRTIIEPFAGAAGYSLRYPDRQIILVEKYPIVAEMWRYLVTVSADEVRRVPVVEHVDALPTWVPAGARSLVGFSMNDANVSPRRQLSAGRKRSRENGRKFEGWCEARRERVASQVDLIRHWQIIEGEYHLAPNIEATWFIDPPYNNRAGKYYVHSQIDYAALSTWCRDRRGQTIVCEHVGADWLPFRPFALQRSMTNLGSHEAIWESSCDLTYQLRNSG